jgi:hypothetical protein
MVRLLPGAYVLNLTFNSPTVAPLEIVGTGASIHDFTAMRITEGADLKLRGIELIGVNTAVSCGNDANVRSRLRIVDSTLRGASASAGLLRVENCDVEVVSTRFAGGNDSNGSSSLALGSTATVIGDRLHFTGSKHAISMFGPRASLTLTNSVLEDPEFFLLPLDNSAPGSFASFGFNTIVVTSPSNSIFCIPDPFLTARFENNILAAIGTNSNSVDETDGCTFTNNIMSPQASAPAGNLVVDPQFIDAANKNYRVQPTSPAVGAADPALTIASDHDFEGTSRPQGGASDIGAFEQ